MYFVYSHQARSSYLPNEVLWGYRFVNLLNFKHSESEYKIDYSAFNSVYRWRLSHLSWKSAPVAPQDWDVDKEPGVERPLRGAERGVEGVEGGVEVRGGDARQLQGDAAGIKKPEGIQSTSSDSWCLSIQVMYWKIFIAIRLSKNLDEIKLGRLISDIFGHNKTVSSVERIFWDNLKQMWLVFCCLNQEWNFRILFSSPGVEQLRYGTTQGHRVALRSST